MDVLYQDACMCFCVCGVFVCVMRRELQSLFVWVILYNILCSWHKRKLGCCGYFMSWCWCLDERVCLDLISPCCYELAYMLCPTAVGGYGMNTRHGWVRFLLDLLFPFLFIFCLFFFWWQWLTGQFGDVWLFIISEGVSGLELKSFILDWFSRFFFFFFYHMTFTLCQSVNTPSLSHGVFIHIYTLRVALCERLHVAGKDNL